MADISMCKNYSCPSRNKCYRFTAIANELWQTYADFELKDGEDKCDYFWDNNGYNNLNNDKNK